MLQGPAIASLAQSWREIHPRASSPQVSRRSQTFWERMLSGRTVKGATGGDNIKNVFWRSSDTDETKQTSAKVRRTTCRTEQDSVFSDDWRLWFRRDVRASDTLRSARRDIGSPRSPEYLLFGGARPVRDLGSWPFAVTTLLVSGPARLFWRRKRLRCRASTTYSSGSLTGGEGSRSTLQSWALCMMFPQCRNPGTCTVQVGASEGSRERNRHFLK